MRKRGDASIAKKHLSDYHQHIMSLKQLWTCNKAQIHTQTHPHPVNNKKAIRTCLHSDACVVVVAALMCCCWSCMSMLIFIPSYTRREEPCLYARVCAVLNSYNASSLYARPNLSVLFLFPCALPSVYHQHFWLCCQRIFATISHTHLRTHWQHNANWWSRRILVVAERIFAFGRGLVCLCLTS